MRTRLKKTNRPHSYPPERRAQWVAHAIRTSIDDAARTYGVSSCTVRKHLIAAGHTPKRVGAPASYDPEFVADIVAHRAESGSTKATARAFAVHHQTVTRFFIAAKHALPIAS